MTIKRKTVQHIKTYNLRSMSNVKDNLDIITIENRKTTYFLLTIRLFIDLVFLVVDFGSWKFVKKRMFDVDRIILNIFCKGLIMLAFSVKNRYNTVLFHPDFRPTIIRINDAFQHVFHLSRSGKYRGVNIFISIRYFAQKTISA